MDMNMHGDTHKTHHTDPAKQSEHAAAHKLITSDNATHTAVKNGSWFDASTWQGGRIPGKDAKVVIPQGINVTYDNVSDQRLFGLRVDGQLDFATDADTQMIIDTFVVSSEGTLTIGTENNPVQGNVQTKILIADNGAIDTNWDPQQLSRGIVSHGTVSIHGQAKTSHLKVATDPAAGDTTLLLDSAPVNWQVGDRIVLTGTRYERDASETEDEERLITNIEGNRITLDKPLSHSHGTPRADLKAYVANQSRNVVIATENADNLPSNQRGHVMLMHSDNVDVRYAEFNELGRTDKSKPLDDFLFNNDATSTRILDNEGNPIPGARTNIRGRYTLHLHRTGVNGDNEPAAIVGNSIVGSPGWGIVQHDSYAVLENNVAYDVLGASFVTETGNEIGAWRNNISIKNDGRRSGIEKSGVGNHDLGFNGHGFWYQSRLVENEGNVAAGSNGSGIFYFHRGVDQINPLTKNLPIEALARNTDTIPNNNPPIVGFINNEVLASGSGLRVIKSFQPQLHDGRTVLDGFTAWEVAQGTELQYTAHYTLKDFTLLGADNIANDPRYSWLSEGLHLARNVEDMVLDNIQVEGFDRGVLMDKENVSTPTLNDWGYFFIDPQINNNNKDWTNLDPSVDRVLSRSDIQPGQLEFELDAANSDLVLRDGENKDAIFIKGTKTDSLGEIELPFGSESLGYYFNEARRLGKNGYYTLPDGRRAVILDEYISDRLTGDLRKYSFIVTIENEYWTKDDPHLGALDPSQVQQSSGIIPFETIAGNHPKFVQDKIVADVSQDAPSTPVIEPETNPTVPDPVVTPPVGDPTPDPDPIVTPPVNDPSIPDPVVTPPVNDPSIPDSPQPIDGDGTGLTAKYFNNTDFTDLGLTRTDAAVDFEWRQGDSPDSAIGDDTFSVRWSGQIEPLYSETYTFTTRSDDGVRLWVNGELLIDNWTQHWVTENTGEITLQAGQKYDIQMEFYEAWGDATAQLYWSSASQEREIVPTSQLYSDVQTEPDILQPDVGSDPNPPIEEPADIPEDKGTDDLPTVPDTPNPSIDGDGTGLTAEYFNNTDFTDLGLTRTDAAIDFEWRQGDSPDSAIGDDTFSVRWSGQIEPLYSETYTFTTRSDDGVRLWVNGELLIDNWTQHWVTENTGEITLQAGQKYDIQMEFYEAWGDATAQLYWSSTSQEREIVPTSQLYSTVNSTVQGDANNNVLTATGKNDLIIGTQPLDTTPGQNEIDVLIGGDGRDTFVLGDANRTFYDDGDIMLGGLDDYALIQGFKPVQGDRIQLHGSLDSYTLGESPTGLPSGAAIFYKDNGSPELVAIVEDAKVSDLSGNFTFV